MKILILFIIILINFSVIAQDNIIKIDGSEVKAKVTEIELDLIKYKRFDNMDGPTYSISKSKVFMIKYENGTKDLFYTPQPTSIDLTDKDRLPDSLIIKSGIYITGGVKFGFESTFDEYSNNKYMRSSFGGAAIEVGGVLYLRPKYMPKHFAFGLNFMFLRLGFDTVYGIWPYTSSIGPQVSFRAARKILVDFYCKPGISLIKLEFNNYFQPEFIMDAGIDLRLKSFIIGASGVFYPNQPSYSHIKIRIGAFIPLKKTN
jgi:hypothetical protein